jgi:amidase
MTFIDDNYVTLKDVGKLRLAHVAGAADANIEAVVDKIITAADCEAFPALLQGLATAHAAGLTLIGAEVWAAFGHQKERLSRMGPDVRNRLLGAARIGAEEIRHAETVREQFTDEVDKILDGCDAIVLPALPSAPPRLGFAMGSSVVDLTRLLRPFNLSGHPAIVLPWRGDSTFPIAVQLVGRRGADAELCAAARHLEKAIAQAAGERT